MTIIKLGVPQPTILFTWHSPFPCIVPRINRSTLTYECHLISSINCCHTSFVIQHLCSVDISLVVHTFVSMVTPYCALPLGFREFSGELARLTTSADGSVRRGGTVTPTIKRRQDEKAVPAGPCGQMSFACTLSSSLAQISIPRRYLWEIGIGPTRGARCLKTTIEDTRLKSCLWTTSVERLCRPLWRTRHSLSISGAFLYG